jgi:hypothetical protein
VVFSYLEKPLTFSEGSVIEMTNTDVVIPMASAIIVSYITSFGYHLYKGQITEKPLSVEKYD